jgi:DNA-binding response OmpR family regulator
MSVKVLIVDDSPEILELLRIVLTRNGYVVMAAESARAAADIIRQQKPDLIILDIMLPDITGISFLETLKKSKQYCDIPIILLTAKDKNTDMVRGLKVGADDYIVKPFNGDVLVARVETILRRCNPDSVNGKILSAGQIAVHIEKRKIFVNSNEIFLTPSELNILIELMRANERPVDRKTLYAENGNSGARVIDAHVTSIRKKLGPARKQLRTVHGMGYKIISPAN